VSLTSRALSLAALLLAVTIPATPGLGSGQRNNAWSDRHGPGDGERDFARGHREHFGRGWHRRADVVLLPYVGLAVPAIIAPALPPIGMVPGMTISPPVRFQYYCAQPPGWFPAVANCAVAWSETGVQP
jgi:hypothetical protein